MCRFTIWAFSIAYVVALLLLLVGTYGLFGSPRGPLAGVFLMPLGLPWNLLMRNVGYGPAVAALAPLVNLGILVAICKALQKR